MSCVSNYTLFLGAENDGEVDALPSCIQTINSLLPEELALRRVDGCAGGDKAMEHGVFALAGDHLLFEVVRDAILSIHWPAPDALLLVFLGQGELSFSTFTHAQLRQSRDL